MKKVLIVFAIICILTIIAVLYLKTKSDDIFNIIKADEDFSFYIITDTHYLSDKSHDDGEAFQNQILCNDKLIDYTVELFDAAVENIKINKPDFVVISGDLTCNGSEKCHLEFSKKLNEVEKGGTDVYVIPGNHDIMNKDARYFYGEKSYSADMISDEKFKEIYKKFGYGGAISYDEDSLSYLIAPSEKFWLLMIDTSLDYPNHGGTIKTSTLNWIEECSILAKNQNARLIAVMHHSLIDHSKIINQDYTIINSEESLKVFQKHDINLVFTGHIHLQDIKTINYDNKKLYDISTNSLSVYPHQLGKVYYSLDEGFEYKTEKLNMKEYALTNKINDENLLNFDFYSEKFFINNCCKNQQDCICNLTELSQDEKDKLFEVIAELNKMYFSGYRNGALNYVKTMEGYEILINLKDCAVKNYALSILNDEMTNNNILYIPDKK